MMEGILKGVIQHPVEPPRKRKRISLLKQVINAGKEEFYIDENGEYHTTLVKGKKPPEPKNNDFDWVWWDEHNNGNGGWIKMYNDVFEGEKSFISKTLEIFCFRS
jgi:hypothetical protein